MQNEGAEWSVGMVIQMAGIPLADADERLFALARVALDRCYYLDRAAEWLLNALDARARRALEGK